MTEKSARTDAEILIGDGTSTLHLQVTGCDIDDDDEISVWLNGAHMHTA